MSHIDVLGMLTETLAGVMERLNGWEDEMVKVERGRLEVERECLVVKQRRLEIKVTRYAIECQNKGLWWGMWARMDEDRLPLKLTATREWGFAIVEFVQGSSKDGGAQVKQTEDGGKGRVDENVEEDADEEMGSDEEGGEAEVQTEMGTMLPPSQPPL